MIKALKIRKASSSFAEVHQNRQFRQSRLIRRLTVAASMVYPVSSVNCEWRTVCFKDCGHGTT